MPLDQNTDLNFDLLIEKQEHGYRARVINSPSGEAKHDFVLPFSENELARFLKFSANHFDHFQLSSATQPDAEPLDAQVFGLRLFKAVFVEGIDTLLSRSLDEVRRINATLCIRLRLNDVPELAILPWEYLYYPNRDQFLLLSGQVALIRYMELPEPKLSLPVTLPLRMLVVISHPNDIPSLDVEQEWARLQQALAGLIADDKVVVEQLPTATGDVLQQYLRQGEYHILHFIGHGWFDEQTELSGLIFEDTHGASVVLNAKQLGVLLTEHRALQVIFLNACEGARALSNSAFSGTAQHLVRQNLPAVIALQFPVTDKAAVHLAQTFYQALADEYPVDSALAAARRAVYIAGNFMEWATPVLFMRSDNSHLFQLEPSSREGASKQVESPPMPPLPVAQTGRQANPGERVNAGGNLSLGAGDFVGHNQTIYGDKVSGDKIGGDKTVIDKIVGTNIAIGRGAQVNVNTRVTNATVAEFVQLFNEVRTKLATVKLEEDEQVALQQDIANVEAQLAKPEPKLALIRRGLNNIKEIIEATTSVSTAAVALSALVQRAIQMAQQLFK